MTRLAVGSDSTVMQTATLKALNLIKPGFASPLEFNQNRSPDVTERWGLQRTWPLADRCSDRLVWIVPKNQMDEPELLNIIRLVTLQQLRGGFFVELVVPRVSKSIQDISLALGCHCREFTLLALLSQATSTPRNFQITNDLQQLYFASLAYVMHGFEGLVADRNNLYRNYLKPLLNILQTDFTDLSCPEFSEWSSRVLYDIGLGKPMSSNDTAIWQNLKATCDGAASEVLQMVRASKSKITP